MIVSVGRLLRNARCFHFVHQGREPAQQILGGDLRFDVYFFFGGGVLTEPEISCSYF